ncbi:MAG: dihydropteroate synthase [Elusimicrobia bacterium CG1_02_37_114]|nr:MAG: dihydropteroate synthase [Elusimicrobia bacterium CG1_02_37_114]
MLKNLNGKASIMGILNVTPDSFYDGGRYRTINSTIRHVEDMISCGADIIDVGGESTRPGAKPVSLEEERQRVLPVINEIKKHFDIPVSVDTYKSEIARQALEAGAGMVNDISGLRYDRDMVKLISERKASVVIMHMQGTPRSMQDKPYYKNVVDEIKEFFERQIKFAINNGIKKEYIMLDPGIGFGKTTQHNVEILKNLHEFTKLGFPLMVGTSRKSFIGKILGTEQAPLPPQDRLVGTITTCMWAVINGANFLRVHDVKEIKHVLKILEDLRN